MKRIGTIGVLGMILLAAAGCGAAASAQTVSDYASLISHLHASGLTAEADQYVSSVRQPFLSVSGHAVNVNGQRIEVYEYRSAAAANADAKRIDDDACLAHVAGGTTMMDWPGVPHLYKRGRVIVIYVGTDKRIISALVAALGPQFAGK